MSFGSHPNSQIIRSDSVRIIEAVITGISFLGAGTIFRDRRSHVTGLTTAASLLFSGGIGVAIALRQWIIAVGATLLVLLVLRVLNWVENRLNKKTTLARVD